MIILREFAPAKINLYLHVTGRRSDGYHLLDSLVAFAGVGDKLEVTPDNALKLDITGPYASQTPQDNNSVLKAAHALQTLCGVKQGAALTLHKNLPVGSGIGGGSGDAAAALRLLARFWKLQPPAAGLDALALSIGADVPACRHGAALYMSGIGEVIEPAPAALSSLFTLLVNPGKPLLTKDVFKRLGANVSKPVPHRLSFASAQERMEFLRGARNDLQEAAIALVPEIRDVLMAINAQKDCLLARMSGSGATCFGLFYSLSAAQAAATQLSAQNPDWWVSATTLH